jgi:transaldolase
MAKTNLQQLLDLGQSPWIDYLSRDLVHGGELERLSAEHGIVGVTSNPTIFQKAISTGSSYDAQLNELAGEPDLKEVFLELAARDVTDALAVLRPVWDRTEGADGYVSLEVDPTLAYETEATFAQARRFHDWIDQPNLLVKIPATRAGLPAIEDMIAAGRSINVTLIFSLERYAEVVEAYIRGLERLVAGGGDPRKVASVASFFVSRVDTEVDNRLDAIGGDALELRGRLAVANAKLAYQHWKEAFSGERWDFLVSKGASTQRCLWASTSTKNPDYPDTMYVDDLVGPDTVNTMPQETIEAFEDHGTVAVTLEDDIDGARRLFADIEAAGVDLAEVWDTLEDEGVQKFADSFTELLDALAEKRGQLVEA